MTTNEICVEVVFALPDQQKLVEIALAPGSTVNDALRQSEFASQFPEFDFAAMDVAVWGKPVGKERQLLDGDRVEILRQLEIDPRDARRELAKAGQYMSSLKPGG
jgi:putative ubiquitin-RnfH superfamily antitoxin RatB of RatAB toxin-antitoxin module